MIKSEHLDDVVKALVKWIEDRADAARAKTGVIGLSGGADSALVAMLLKRSTKIGAMGVLMPCHSSPDSLEDALELAKKIDLPTITVDLSKSHDLISAQVHEAFIKGGVQNVKDNATEGALRSCLRAPTLDYVAKRLNGFVVGTGNRDEDEVTRYFQKRGDGAVDISPIAKLHKSEVYQLLRHLGCTEKILTKTPTADLWGPNAGQTDEGQLGISYPEIEWAIQFQDQFHGVFFGSDSWGHVPSAAFLNVTERQRYVLKTLQRMEQASRHKAEMPPVFEIRSGFHNYFVEYNLDIPGLPISDED